MESWAGRDTAYVCFLFSGSTALAIRGLGALPLDTGTAGGIGFLVVLPLFGAALIAVGGGVVLTVIHHDDWGLGLLALLSAAYLVQFFAEWGSPAVQSMVPLAYGVVVVAVCGTWFLHRRRKHRPGRE